MAYYPSGMQNRLEKLARRIDALVKQDEELARRTEAIARMRMEGARQLHAICGEFVRAVNALLENVMVELAPAEFREATFREAGVTLYQINASGRIIQFSFEITDGLTSTELHRAPYTLQGTVRWFNQELLERVEIREEYALLFVDKSAGQWRHYDPRTHRGGPIDHDFLVSLMEQLV